MDLTNVKENDKICFKYRQRHVRITVFKNLPNFITGILETDYIGKNEEWFKGESKLFSKSLITKLSNW